MVENPSGISIQGKQYTFWVGNPAQVVFVFLLIRGLFFKENKSTASRAIYIHSPFNQMDKVLMGVITSAVMRDVQNELLISIWRLQISS